MKKKNTGNNVLRTLACVSCVMAMFSLSACNQNRSTSSSEQQASSSNVTSSQQSSSEQLKDFADNVKLNDVSYPYDGTSKTIEVSNLPSGASVTYHGEKSYKDAGSYTISATISMEGYNSKETTATLTITTIDYPINQVSLTPYVGEYNGQVVTITLNGTLPEGVTCNIKYYTDEACTNEAAEVKNAGIYYGLATFSGDSNHNAIGALKTTITINKAKVDVPTAVSNLVYNGQQQEGVTGFDTSLVNISNDKAVNAGTYQANVTLKDEANYSWSDASFNGNISYTIAKRVITLEATTLFEYDGNEKVCIAGNEYFEVSGGQATNAGEYSAKCNIIDTQNCVFEDGSTTKNISYSISKRTLNVEGIKISSSIKVFANGGENLAPAPTYVENSQAEEYIKSYNVKYYAD